MSDNVLITTPRLTITELRPDDEIPHTRLMLGDKFYEHFLRETGKAPDLPHTEEMYAIRINDAYIGWVVLQKDEQGRPDVGIKIMSTYHGRGYGPEALKEVRVFVREGGLRLLFSFASGLDTVFIIHKPYVTIS